MQSSLPALCPAALASMITLRTCRTVVANGSGIDMGSSPRYRVNITRRGPPPRPFGWEICRCDDAAEVERSRDTFRARYEAIADGERAAQELDAKQDVPT
jgi:hypothetical protein